MERDGMPVGTRTHDRGVRRWKSCRREWAGRADHFVPHKRKRLAAQRVEKASQSFAPAGAKTMQIIFPGGVYVGKIHSGLQMCRLSAFGGQLVRAAGRGLLSKNSKGVFRQSQRPRRIPRRGRFCRGSDSEELAGKFQLFFWRKLRVKGLGRLFADEIAVGVFILARDAA